MRRKNELNLGEAIRHFIREMGMEEKILEQMALEAWNDQMGEFVANKTDTIYIKNHVLFVRINVPALKNELSYGKEKILTHINETLGKEFITDVKFI